MLPPNPRQPPRRPNRRSHTQTPVDQKRHPAQSHVLHQPLAICRRPNDNISADQAGEHAGENGKDTAGDEWGGVGGRELQGVEDEEDAAGEGRDAG